MIIGVRCFPVYGLAVLSSHCWPTTDLLDFMMLLHASLIDKDNFHFLFGSCIKCERLLFCGSIWLSWCKIIYYTIFSWMYGFVGSCAHLAMVNSSWTQSHIEKLWRISNRTKRVYPPCDTTGLQVCSFFSSIKGRYVHCSVK